MEYGNMGSGTAVLILVSNILADLAAGQSFDEIIGNYPNVNPDDIRAALEFGSQLAQFENVLYEAKVS
jgi:uncharacterized protein (DUF433 family)